MAKKKTSKVKEETPIIEEESESEVENDSNPPEAEVKEEIVVSAEEFSDACAKFRTAKIEANKYEAEMEKLEPIIKNYAISNEVKGVFNGVEIKQRFTFLPEENVAKAKELGIEVPASGNLFLPEEQLKKIIVQAGLDPQKLMTYTPDLPALKKLFKKAKIEGVYSLGVSLSLSDVD